MGINGNFDSVLIIIYCIISFIYAFYWEKRQTISINMEQKKKEKDWDEENLVSFTVHFK